MRTAIVAAMTTHRRWLRGLLVPGVLIAVWWLATSLRWVDPRLLPSIESVALVPFDPVVRRLVLEGIVNTLTRNVEGALIGSFVGLLFGAALGLSRLFDQALGPSFHAFRNVAMFAWVPLLTAWFGLGEATRILFIAIAAFKPMVMNTQEGIRSAPRQYLEVGRALCLSRRQLLCKIVLPAALPSILAGLQLAFIYSWLATIGVETLVSFTKGIGSVLHEGQQHFRMDVLFFGILLIGSLGFVFNSLVRLAGRQLLKGHHA
jgi:sulfonate transport system permease protein